ncbi:MAG: tRNA pseudouridine(55) synthase TruB [Halobacteriovoraceae bacterium]|nr:tRNA pseudouridine(55) synthase TruB [Halobacteriovoraceae bacterium]
MENSFKKELYNQPLVFSVLKPPGPSSFDIIRHFKKNLPFKPRKIGHFGTLDPFASGVFLVGLNSALRLNELAHEHNRKTYLAIGKIGYTTDTGDRTGSICLNSSYKPTLAEINKALNCLASNEYKQTPPHYSAAKCNGKPLYKWARQGVLIQKDAVQRTIFEARIVKYHYPYLSIKVSVSTGTYIRKLFEDLLELCGTRGHLISLVRTNIGPFNLKNSILKKNWPKIIDNRKHIENLSFRLTNILPFEKLDIGPENSKKFLNGCKINVSTQEHYNWIMSNKQVLGIGKNINQEITPHIVFKN